MLRWSFWIDQFFKVSVLFPSLYLQVPSFLALKQTVARAISNSGVVPEKEFLFKKFKVVTLKLKDQHLVGTECINYFTY